MSRTPLTMPYLIGFKVKPYATSSLGIVTFTDGAAIVTPNQLQCEAYGYTYNKVTGTCSTFRYNTNLNRSVANENNKTFGTGNTTETGTNNTLIMGENNTVKGFSRNSVITGSQNEIANGVDNVSVSGTLAEATASGSTVQGGNNPTDALGMRQAIQLQYGRQTTDNGTESAYLNNVTGEFFEVPLNSIIYFHADTLAVRVGGSSGEGAVGDYASYVERGVVINKSGVLSIQRERDTIKTSGDVTNWRILASKSGTNFFLTVRGQSNMDIEWNCSVNITQIKTGVTL